MVLESCRRLGLAALLALAGAGCGGTLPSYPYAQEPDPRRTEYVLGPSDELTIRVWQNHELDTNIRIRPDGTITMPLVGDVRAAGLTPTQLKAEIKKVLSAYIKDPSMVVTVAVSAVNSYRVVVTGNVAAPGVYESSRYLTVGEAIARAGGPGRFAKPKRTLLIRKRDDGSIVYIPIRYDLIASGDHLEQDIFLLRGDQIYMP